MQFVIFVSPPAGSTAEKDGEVHWKDASFHSFAVVPVPTMYFRKSRTVLEHNEMHSLLRGPIRNITKLPQNYCHDKELKFMFETP